MEDVFRGRAACTSADGRSLPVTIPMNGTVNPFAVNVQVSVGGGATQTVGYAGTMAQCGSGGWYYDNAMTPTKITLCPSTCDPLKATMNSKVQLLFGCPTVGPGVPK